MRAGVALLGLCCLVTPAMASPGDKSPRDLYEVLNALRPDPRATYELASGDRSELRRSAAQFYFEHGKLTFLAPLDGRITGAVFSGRGHVLAAPRDPVEKQQMGRFLGSPVLDQAFGSAYLRFTDGTADELLLEFRKRSLAPQTDTTFLSQWEPTLRPLNEH